MKFVRADNPVSTKHKKLGEIKVEVEVPQVESTEEAISFCGGEQEFLDFFNGAISTSAKNGGRVILRSADEDANLEELQEKVRRVVREYSPRAVSKGPSVKKLADAAKRAAEALQSGQELSREELLEMLLASR